MESGGPSQACRHPPGDDLGTGDWPEPEHLVRGSGPGRRGARRPTRGAAPARAGSAPPTRTQAPASVRLAAAGQVVPPPPEEGGPGGTIHPGIYRAYAPTPAIVFLSASVAARRGGTGGVDVAEVRRLRGGPLFWEGGRTSSTAARRSAAGRGHRGARSHTKPWVTISPFVSAYTLCTSRQSWSFTCTCQKPQR